MSLSYPGGGINIQCNNSGGHKCDESGGAPAGTIWSVKTCQVFVGGVSLSNNPSPCSGGNCTTAGFDTTRPCNFND
jgi:hypothetical protein